MSRRLGTLLAAVAATALFAVTLAPLEAEAQERGRIMVINMSPTDGSSDRFGQRAADQLRGLIDLPQHRGMSSRDIDQAARQFDMRLNNLDCVSARQLAAQVQVPLVMCGDYAADGNQYRVEVSFYAVPAMEEYPMEPFTVAQNDERGTAQQILSHLEVLIEQDQYVSYCGAEFGSENWQQALEYCTRAVEVAPQSVSARRALAITYVNLEEYETAMELFEEILEVDAWDPNALENAGYVSAQLGDTDKAREYYSRFLEINPDNATVRAQVAYSLSQAGDYQGAIDLLKEGLERDPDHIGLLEQYGSIVFRLAQEKQAFAPQQQDSGPTISPEVAELYREAVETLMRVVEMEGQDANPSFILNSVRAYVQLGEYQDALRTADRGLQIFPDDAALLSEKAGVQNRMGDVDQAVATLERALQIDPDLRGARGRMGNFYMQAGRISDALPHLRAAVEGGELTGQQVASAILQHAFSTHIQPERDIMEGVRLLELAKSFETTPEMQDQLNYFHGRALLSRGIQVHGQGENLQTACASRPIFQEARRWVQQGRAHADRTASINYGQLIENIDAYLDIQNAIIQRDGRGSCP